MPTTDQPPLKIGEVYYLKRVSVYHQCTLCSLHEFQNTAKVDYYADGELVICRRSELITEEQYKAVLKQRAKEAYERDAPKRMMEARDKYRHIIGLWERGVRDSKLMAGELEENPRAIGQMIAAAKRWKLISSDDKESSTANSNPGG